MKRESSGGPEPVKTLRYREDEARAKFDRVAGFYYWIMGFMENKVNRQAIVMAEIRPVENVLDAGFGTGGAWRGSLLGSTGSIRSRRSISPRA